jgi:malate dehydrogenase (oxaloacetate-decarboxylating)(NADP+)
MSFEDEALGYHAGGRPGKLEVVPTKCLDTQRDLSLAYSPGVAGPCRAIARNDDDVFRYTAKGNLVAVVSNGSAVLGLGNIGPHAAKPVMEGKANLFKKFADIDVFDIELDATTVDEIVTAVAAIAPTFGGINLEDIKSPECFEVERRLQDMLDIPVFHDDQHGTAIISAAALINAAALTNRRLDEMKMAFSGAGAAALACARHYVALGVKPENIIVCDSRGVLYTGRDRIFDAQLEFVRDTDARTLADAVDGADVFIGLSVGNVLTPEMLKTMAPNPIVFAMANPDPEIPYDLARETRPDAIVATGRSDTPNQVNNVLGFPFVFRGALDCYARKITQEMKVAATEAIAALAREDVPDTVLRAYGENEMSFGPEYLIPKPFDPRVLLYVAPAVAQAAADSGVARSPIEDLDAYRERLYRLVERSRGLMQPLIWRARSNPTQRIVFPDGEADAVIRAAVLLREQGICQPLLLGDPERIAARAEVIGSDLDGIEIDAAGPSPLFDELANDFWEQRQRMGLTLAAARAFLSDRVYYAAMLVKRGLADGLVGGLGRPYKYTLRPAIRVLGTRSPETKVSGVYTMIYQERKIFLGDCTVNLYPDAETLAQVALNTAAVAESFGETPRVAMLSYSDFGEHRKDAKVAIVREAIEIVRQRRPDLQIDGEMQADTAIDPVKAAERFPFSALDGAANVLIFPDLTSGNIAYKLLTHLSDAEALGPLLQGLAAPVNIIPVYATVNEVVNVATYTVHQALDAKLTD